MCRRRLVEHALGGNLRIEHARSFLVAVRIIAEDPLLLGEGLALRVSLAGALSLPAHHWERLPLALNVEPSLLVTRGHSPLVRRALEPRLHFSTHKNLPCSPRCSLA